MFTFLKILNSALSLVPHKTITSAFVFAITVALRRYFPDLTTDDVYQIIQNASEAGFDIGLFAWRLSDYIAKKSE